MTSDQPPQPSYEELAALVVELKLLVSAQAVVIAEQAERIAELERQTGSDSHNSSKPPSSDGLRKKPAPKSLRQWTGCKPGRAKGDPGGRLEQVADPDAIVDHHPAACDACGDGLSGAVSAGYRARQVFDLPEIRPEVIEHRLYLAVCGCGHTTLAKAPQQVVAATVYGAGVRAAICYLSTYQHLPAKRLAEAMGALFGLPVSTGTVLSVLARAHTGLADFEEQVKDHLRPDQECHRPDGHGRLRL